MFATPSPRHSIGMAYVLATALLGPGAAFAQKQQFERTKVLVNVGLPVQQDLAPSFAIDMALHSDGRLQGHVGIFSINQVPHENNKDENTPPVCRASIVRSRSAQMSGS